MSFNIAIDGPAGAGKSTIAKQLAKELSCGLQEPCIGVWHCIL